MTDIIDWFASDHHFGHKRIVEFANRPFTSVEQMDEQMIAEHNEVVRPQDRVWFVGDFSFYEAKVTDNILRRMHGQKALIKGNHDHTKRMGHLFQDVVLQKELKIGDDHIVLNHFPMVVWNKSHYGSYMLHGHSHGNLTYPGNLGKGRIFDVGVDHLFKVFGSFAPVCWQQIKEHLKNRTYVHLDHHKERNFT